MKKVLTIAGSDCSGGAGIQADIKTITCHQMYAMSVITAATAQNTLGVAAVADLSADFVAQQIDCIFQDIVPDAVKVGMLSNVEIILSLTRKFKQYQPKNIVIDPVMISTSNCPLLKNDAIQCLKTQLLPLADIITPNLHEAQYLTAKEINNKDDMEMAARILYDQLGCNVLIKGGHSKENSDDYLLTNDKGYWLDASRINNPNTHGTGCTLSSAIACNLANGQSMIDSVSNAKQYVLNAIKDNLDLGKGNGPLNHMWNLK